MRALFGKKKPEESKDSAPISKEEQEKRAFDSIQKAIDEGRQKVEGFYMKLDKKEKEIKTLISIGKKEDARKKTRSL